MASHGDPNPVRYLTSGSLPMSLAQLSSSQPGNRDLASSKLPDMYFDLTDSDQMNVYLGYATYAGIPYDVAINQLIEHNQQYHPERFAQDQQSEDYDPFTLASDIIQAPDSPYSSPKATALAQNLGQYTTSVSDIVEETRGAQVLTEAAPLESVPTFSSNDSTRVVDPIGSVGNSGGAQVLTEAAPLESVPTFSSNDSTRVVDPIGSVGNSGGTEENLTSSNSSAGDSNMAVYTTDQILDRFNNSRGAQDFEITLEYNPDTGTFFSDLGTSRFGFEPGYIREYSLEELGIEDGSSLVDTSKFISLIEAQELVDNAILGIDLPEDTVRSDEEITNIVNGIVGNLNIPGDTQISAEALNTAIGKYLTDNSYITNADLPVVTATTEQVAPDLSGFLTADDISKFITADDLPTQIKDTVRSDADIQGLIDTAISAIPPNSVRSDEDIQGLIDTAILAIPDVETRTNDEIQSLIDASIKNFLTAEDLPEDLVRSDAEIGDLISTAIGGIDYSQFATVEDLKNVTLESLGGLTTDQVQTLIDTGRLTTEDVIDLIAANPQYTDEDIVTIAEGAGYTDAELDKLFADVDRRLNYSTLRLGSGLTSLARSVATIRGDLVDVNDLIVTAQGDIIDNAGNIVELNDSVTTLDGQVIDLGDRIDLNEVGIGNLGENLTALGVDVDTLGVDLGAVRDRVLTTESDISNVQLGLGDLTGRVETTEGELVSVNDLIVTAQGDIVDNAGNIVNLQENVTTIDGQVIDLTGRIDVNQVGIGNLGDNLDALGVDVTNLGVDLSDVTDRVSATEGDITGIQTDISGIQTDISGISGIVDQLKIDVTDVNGRIDLVEITFQSAVDALQEQHDAEIAIINDQLANDIPALQAALDALTLKQQEDVDALTIAYTAAIEAAQLETTEEFLGILEDYVTSENLTETLSDYVTNEGLAETLESYVNKIEDGYNQLLEDYGDLQDQVDQASSQYEVDALAIQMEEMRDKIDNYIDQTGYNPQTGTVTGGDGTGGDGTGGDGTGGPYSDNGDGEGTGTGTGTGTTDSGGTPPGGGGGTPPGGGGGPYSDTPDDLDPNAGGGTTGGGTPPGGGPTGGGDNFEDTDPNAGTGTTGGPGGPGPGPGPGGGGGEDWDPTWGRTYPLPQPGGGIGSGFLGNQYPPRQYQNQGYDPYTRPGPPAPLTGLTALTQPYNRPRQGEPVNPQYNPTYNYPYPYNGPDAVDGPELEEAQQYSNTQSTRRYNYGGQIQPITDMSMNDMLQNQGIGSLTNYETNVAPFQNAFRPNVRRYN
jgi:hypothetical protein